MVVLRIFPTCFRYFYARLKAIAMRIFPTWFGFYLTLTCNVLKSKGLICFTGEYGAFPEKKPDCDAAFVFVADEYNNPDVLPWAIKLVLQKDEI